MAPANWPLLLLLANGLLLAATACLALSANSLNRLQRKAWLGIETGSEEESDDAYVLIESALGSLSLSRQLLLIGVMVQGVVTSRQFVPDAGVAVGLGVAAGLYLVFDKLIPYAGLVTLGSDRVLRWGDPLLTGRAPSDARARIRHHRERHLRGRSLRRDGPGALRCIEVGTRGGERGDGA